MRSCRRRSKKVCSALSHHAPIIRRPWRKLARQNSSRRAATAEHYPTIDVEGELRRLGVTPANSHGTFHGRRDRYRIPIFQGGRSARRRLAGRGYLQPERGARLEDLRGQIDNDVRNALLDLNAAADAVEVARSSVDLAEQTLEQARIVSRPE